MSCYKLTVASPDGNLFEGQVYSLSLRGVEGELAILAGHVPFITSVVACTCRIEEEDGTERIGHTDGGILTVSAEGTVLLASGFAFEE
ncbi:MAG: F0F1 ATP synthase subunit epsilon [Clostridia bacterium]|nr:F0F1 ATP synthase subunit epsilon [Clostridia bacterium]